MREEVWEANLELVRRGLILYSIGNASSLNRKQVLPFINPFKIVRIAYRELSFEVDASRRSQALLNRHYFRRRDRNPPCGQEESTHENHCTPNRPSRVNFAYKGRGQFNF